MQKITTSTIAVIILTIPCLFALPAQAQYNGGTGDPCDPFQINDPCQLNAIGANPDDWDKHFILTADIDLSAYTGEQFNIIASDTDCGKDWFQGTKFTGSFDGNGHIITNFTYATTDTDYIGLFGCVGDDGEIKGLGMTDVSISGGYDSRYLGGLVGYNCGSISTCYAIGSISGGNYSESLGGLVGFNSTYYGRIGNCYATVSVSGGDNSVNLGGLVGHNSGGISSCYATGNVSGYDYLGGLVGCNHHHLGGISNCYATGSVSGGGEEIGGLVGHDSSGPYNSSFWDSEVNPGLAGVGNINPDPCGVIGETTANMQIQSTFTSAGWDFVGETTNGTNEVWQMSAGGGYPVLSSFSGYSPPLLAGNGTPDNPYLIGDLNELGAIYHYDNNANYRLVADIDLSGINWSIAPIPFFLGNFDGNGHTINTLIIEGGGYLGLFGYIRDGGEIKNLGVTNVSIIGGNNSDFLGGLAGWNKYGCISNCYITGSISGGDSSQYLGILVGSNSYGSISNCYAIGSVSGGNNSRELGGLVGHCGSGSISNCYAAGSASGDDDIGGLVGWNSGSISDCYATGSVSGGDDTGNLGGLVGYDYYGYGSYSSSFWDSDVNSGLTGVGNVDPDPAGVIGETTANMQIQSTFTDAGWDFVGEDVNGTFDIWRMCVDGIDYPKLSWQFLASDFACPDGVDLADFAVLADTWSLSSGQTGYNDLCDIVDNDIIDLADLAVFAENWLCD